MSSIGRKFAFTINNATGSDKVIALTHANFQTMTFDLSEGTPNTLDALKFIDATEIKKVYPDVDHALDDGIIVTDLTASSGSSKKTIRQFLEWIKYNPRTCKRFSIAADNASFYNNELVVAKSSPIENKGEELIDLKQYYGRMQFNSDRIDIEDLEIVFDQNLMMYINVPNGREVTFTFYF